MTIDALGWQQYKEHVTLNRAFDDGQIARVISENKTNYNLLTHSGERIGVLRGKTLSELNAETKPKAGDWVVFSDDDEQSLAVIEEILPRYSKLSRQSAGDITEEQVLVANVDTVFIVQGLDGDFNINRLERYLIMATNGGVEPVVLLNKADLSDDVLSYVEKVESVAPGLHAIPLSAKTQSGIDELKEALVPSSTAVFVGSSGVGKSTLLNTLIGTDVQETQGLRDDDRGRHTTTRRELFLLDNGSIIIDTPGMRELNVAGMKEVKDTFTDIVALTHECAYTKCDHEKSEGCAVMDAVAAGLVDLKRVKNYRTLLREQDLKHTQMSHGRRLDRKAKNKKIKKDYKKKIKEVDKYKGML